MCQNACSLVIKENKQLKGIATKHKDYIITQKLYQYSGVKTSPKVLCMD